MERYLEELEKLYKENFLKSNKELESFKALIRNAYRAGFIEGHESVLKQLTKLGKI
jgi:hypothetical protein|nr:MAG TPA: hypothetical protein [Bacteriophage sp.]